MEQGDRLASTVVPERQIQDETRPDPGRTARVAEVLTAGSVTSQTTDWHSPPPGFMASPAIEPTSFASIEQGIRMEANRLLGIALAEQWRRQMMGAEGEGKPWDADDDARTRKALHLDALAAIACPGSIDVAGVRYVPESEHERASREHRLIAGGIHHDDGTVTYLDAVGSSWRKPTAHWVAFVAMQLDHRVRAEMARQRMGQGDMTGSEIEAHEARMLRDLRADAVADLAFRHTRAFNAAEALRNGAEPIDAEMRARDDVDLLKLAPQWREASEQYGRAVAAYVAACDAAKPTSPGQAPAGAGPEWQAWRDRVDAWSAENGIDDAEGAMNGALDDLGEIEDRIADLSAASLAGVQLKARVAQRLDDIDIGWPDGLGEGLVRDILAYAEPQPRPVALNLTGLFDFGAATLTELLYLRELADLVGSTAYALGWSGRGSTGYRSGNLTPVGRFMVELGDALTEVESAAEQEARRRQPANPDDRETRLVVFADAVIRSDDPDEIAAFATELTAHAVALREGR